MSGLQLRRLLLALEHLGPSCGALFNVTSLCQGSMQKSSSSPCMLHLRSEDAVQAHGVTGFPGLPHTRASSSFTRGYEFRHYCQVSSDSSSEQTEGDASRRADGEGEGGPTKLTETASISDASETARAEELRQQQWDLEDDLWGDHYTGGGVREPAVSEEGELNLPSGMEIVGMAAVGGAMSR
eukprot:scaffold274991_cov16-Tisochrysis_lutea.AAC.1